jgi:lysophospholipase L1-like esterase
VKLVALGDSLAYGAGDETGGGLAGRLRGTFDTVNLGVNGAQTSDLLGRLRQERVRREVAGADAIVLSIGANDLFRSQAARNETLRAPLAVAMRILGRIEQVVDELRRLNPSARILILGGYNPAPDHPQAPLIDQYLGLWDATLANTFEGDPLVSVVQLSDIVTPRRLSRFDRFHPGGAAYAAAAERIAGMLGEGRPRDRRFGSL